MSDRAGRRRRHKRHKRRTRIGPDFGTGVRRKEFDTMTELDMRYRERDHGSAFQRWHWAKWSRWPSTVVTMIFDKVAGRSTEFDRLVWHDLGEKVAIPETFDPNRHGVEREFFADLFLQMEKDKK